MKLQNEYLVIIDEETSPAIFQLCNTIDRLNELLNKSEERIKVNSKQLIFAHKNKYDYFVRHGEVKGKNQNFFYITIKFDKDEKDLENYRELLRTIKNIFYTNDFIVETLRDDLSFYYSQLSYRLIHKIENLMRKFITYFMITNIGKNWIDESSPHQIKQALSKSKRKEYIDVLQQLDFIHLGDFLFKAYQEEDISHLFDKIKTIKNTISSQELQGYLPKSNWDKYFKEIVDCDDVYLKTRWERLYDLRNKIAHTSKFTVGDYKDIQELVGEIQEKLEKAFENIDTVEMEEDEKEQLSQKIATNLNENIGIFLREWNKLESFINSLGENKVNFTSNFLRIKEKGLFDLSTIETIHRIITFRNNLVHGVDSIEVEEIQKSIEDIKMILQSSWEDEVYQAFIRLGKAATLNEIYKTIENNTNRELSASWKSTVRRTIYYYSSDADIYLGKRDLYKKIGKGKWSLREYPPKTPAT